MDRYWFEYLGDWRGANQAVAMSTPTPVSTAAAAATCTPTVTPTATSTVTPTNTPTATATCAESILRFDGIDDRVTGVNLPTWTQFTVEAWVKRTADTSDYASIVADAYTDYTQAMFTLFVDNGSSDCGSALQNEFAYFQVGDAAFCSGLQPSLDIWCHLAASRDASGSRRFYVDENLVKTLPSSTAPPDSNGTLTFGRAGDHDDEYLERLIDEVRLSSVARYTGASFTPPTAPLSSDVNTVGLWHMDEGTGQDASDSSSNARDGVLGTTSVPQFSDPTWSADSPITG